MAGEVPREKGTYSVYKCGCGYLFAVEDATDKTVAWPPPDLQAHRQG